MCHTYVGSSSVGGSHGAIFINFLLFFDGLGLSHDTFLLRRDAIWNCLFYR
jgi:hypothetical protein